MWTGVGVNRNTEQSEFIRELDYVVAVPRSYVCQPEEEFPAVKLRVGHRLVDSVAFGLVLLLSEFNNARHWFPEPATYQNPSVFNRVSSPVHGLNTNDHVLGFIGHPNLLSVLNQSVRY
jgi:hypothetical protein